MKWPSNRLNALLLFICVTVCSRVVGLLAIYIPNQLLKHFKYANGTTNNKSSISLHFFLITICLLSSPLPLHQHRTAHCVVTLPRMHRYVPLKSYGKMFGTCVVVKASRLVLLNYFKIPNNLPKMQDDSLLQC